MTIQNLNTASKLTIIETHNKNIAHYQNLINDIIQDEKGERKLLSKRINTLIEREIFVNCDIKAFSADFIESITSSTYENERLNTISEFSTAIVDNSDIDLESLRDCSFFDEVFDSANGVIGGTVGNDSEIDLSSGNTHLALQVQRAFDEMTLEDQLEVIGHYDFEGYYEPINYFIVSDYLAGKLRDLGQSVAEWGNLNIMINCSWSLTENSEIIAIAHHIEYDVQPYIEIINNHNTKLGELRQK